jgi:hypothetical protein
LDEEAVKESQFLEDYKNVLADVKTKADAKQSQE